jgi:hypothetical protein
MRFLGGKCKIIFCGLILRGLLAPFLGSQDKGKPQIPFGDDNKEATAEAKRQRRQQQRREGNSKGEKATAKARRQQQRQEGNSKGEMLYCIRSEFFFETATPDSIAGGTLRIFPFPRLIAREALPNCTKSGCCSVTITAVAGVLLVQT